MTNIVFYCYRSFNYVTSTQALDLSSFTVLPVKAIKVIAVQSKLQNLKSDRNQQFFFICANV